jgi:hypothetical protein
MVIHLLKKNNIGQHTTTKDSDDAQHRILIPR